MAETTQEVARLIAEEYDGNAANLWNDGTDSSEVEKRLQDLPGFGSAKSSKIKYVLHYFGHRDFSGEE
jgi:hypothetical protein